MQGDTRTAEQPEQKEQRAAADGDASCGVVVESDAEQEKKRSAVFKSLASYGVVVPGANRLLTNYPEMEADDVHMLLKGQATEKTPPGATYVLLNRGLREHLNRKAARRELAERFEDELVSFRQEYFANAPEMDKRLADIEAPERADLEHEICRGLTDKLAESPDDPDGRAVVDGWLSGVSRSDPAYRLAMFKAARHVANRQKRPRTAASDVDKVDGGAGTVQAGGAA